MERGFVKYVLLGVAVLLAVAGVAQLRRRRKPRSFRDDPIGALKDRGELVANKAQMATDDALARMQETLDELRGRLPDMNRRQAERQRKDLNKRLTALNEQAQALLRDIRANTTFSR
jgi:TolA-binding protein